MATDDTIYLCRCSDLDRLLSYLHMQQFLRQAVKISVNDGSVEYIVLNNNIIINYIDFHGHVYSRDTVCRK